MSPDAVIRRHLGKDVITKTMARDMLAEVQHVGWIISWTQRELCVHYTCCGKTVSNRDRETEYRGLWPAEHRREASCPFCGREIIYINCNHVRQSDREERYHTFYRKSRADRSTIVAIGCWCGVKRYGMAHTDKAWRLIKAQQLKPEMEPVTVTIFPLGGKPEQYMRAPYPLNEKIYSMGWSVLSGKWYKEPTVRGGRLAALQPSSIKHTVHTGWLGRAAIGTAWEPVIRKLRQAEVIPGWDIDLVRTLDEMSRHPQIEYMLAGGLVPIAQAAITGATGGAVNWRGKTMQTMLRLDSNELARLRRMPQKDVKMDGLWLLQQARRNGERVKLEACMELSRSAGGKGAYREAIRKHGHRYGVVRIARALARWRKRIGYTPSDLWLDYVGELIKLGEAGDEERVFPRDLNEAHAQTSARVRVQANRHLDEAIRSRAEELRSEYVFEAEGLRLEPFGGVEEIISEGSRLRICIASYCDAYAKGQTVLLKLRRVNDPDEPFHAVEFSQQGGLIQCRGYLNLTYPEDEQQVRGFWEAWNKAHKQQQVLRIGINDKRRAETV